MTYSKKSLTVLRRFEHKKKVVTVKNFISMSFQNIWGGDGAHL